MNRNHLKFNGISKQCELNNMINDYRYICLKEIDRLNNIILFFQKNINLCDKYKTTGLTDFKKEYYKSLAKRLIAEGDNYNEIILMLHRYRCNSCVELMYKILDIMEEVNKNE